MRDARLKTRWPNPSEGVYRLSYAAQTCQPWRGVSLRGASMAPVEKPRCNLPE